MPTVDLILAALLAAAMAWGVRTGLAGTLSAAGFAVGALVGAGLVPLLLSGGQENDFALVVGLPAALLLGGLLAAAAERRVPAVRRRLKRRRPASVIGGAVVGAGVAVAAAWIAGGVLVQVTSLREPIEDSAIVGALDSLLTRPGPAARPPRDQPLDLFPTARVTGPPIPELDANLVQDPDVLRVDRSVVKINVYTACGMGTGSGWIGRRGVVVTNAHVAAAADRLTIQVSGSSALHTGKAIWFDAKNDVALLRAPSLVDVPVLPVVDRARSGTAAASLGFPRGRHAIRAARIGPTTTRLRGQMERSPTMDRQFPRKLGGRAVTIFRGVSKPGSSGSPIVDARGRVLAMVFGGGSGSYGLAVPIRYVRRALREAGPPVETGTCEIRGR